MTDTSDKHPLDALLPAIHEAIESWRQKNPPEVLKANIHRQLDQDAKEVLLRLMGFDGSWGRWRLDHCNGRSGNSVAGDYLRELQGDAVREWLKGVALPELTEGERSQIENNLRQEYRALLKRTLNAALKQKVQQDVEAIIEAAVPSLDIDNYGQLLQLIQPEGTL